MAASREFQRAVVRSMKNNGSEQPGQSEISLLQTCPMRATLVANSSNSPHPFDTPLASRVRAKLDKDLYDGPASGEASASNSCRGCEYRSRKLAREAPRKRTIGGSAGLPDANAVRRMRSTG